MVAERLSALPEQLVRAFRPKRSWRFVGSLAAALGLAAVFGAALVGGALLHLDTPPARRVARAATNALLGSLFQGRVELGEIRRLHFGGAELESARIIDPGGVVVAQVEGLRATIDTAGLLDSLLFSDGAPRSPILITLPHVQLDRVTTTLLPDEDAIPTIASTFYPRDPTPSDPFARPVMLSIEDIQVDEAHAAGDVGLPVDATVRRAHASLHVNTDELVAIDVDGVGFNERGLLGKSLSGLAEYHLRVRLPKPGDLDPAPRLRMWGSASGYLEQLPFVATISMEGMDLQSKIELPLIDRARLDGLLDALPLSRQASGSVDVAGTLPLLSFGGSLAISQGAGLGSVTFDGQLDVARGPRLTAQVESLEIDPRSFIETMPDARIDARAAVRLDATPGSPRLRVDVQSDATVALGQVIPAIDAVLELAGDRWIASATVHEAGLDVDTRLGVGADGAVDFSVIVPSASLGAAPRLAAWLGGDASARVDGRWADGVLDAKLTGNIASMRVPLGASGVLGAERASMQGRVRGTLDALNVEATAQATRLSAQGESWDDVRVSVAGSLDRLRVTADVRDDLRGHMKARGDLSIPRRNVENVRLELERGGVSLAGTIAELGFDARGLRARGLELGGPELGTLRGGLALRGQELVGELEGRDLDLGRAGRLLALPVDLEGKANVAIALEPTPKGRRGHVELELERGRLLSFDGISARVSMGFEDDRVETSGFVRVIERASEETRSAALAEGLFGGTRLCDGPVLELRFAEGEGRLAGPLLSSTSWRDAVGSVELDTGETNLHCIHRRIPFFINPLERARGLLSARTKLARKSPLSSPSLEDLYLRTHGLELVGKGEAWESHRIDAQLRADVDGERHESRAELLLFDGSMLLEADLEANADLGVLGSSSPLGAALAEVPFELEIHVPRRGIGEFDTLPSPLRQLIPKLAGDLRVDAELSGTPSAPYAYLSAQAFRLGAATTDVVDSLVPPIDLRLGATYEADDAKLGAELEVLHEGVEVAHVSAAVEVPIEELASLRPKRWTGGVHAELLELPLAAFPLLADRDVAGFASGTISLTGLNQRPELDVDVELPFLALGESFVDGRITAHISSPRSGDATDDDEAPNRSDEVLGAGDLRVELEGQDGGAIQLLAHAGFRWEARTIPLLNRDQRGGLVASAERFRLAAAFPFVSGLVSRLDGYLDGKVALEWGRIDDAARGRVALADLSVSEAVVFIPQFGQELRGGKLRLVASTEQTSQGPRTLLTASELEALGTTGRVHGSAEVDLDGLVLTQARASLQIDEGEELPVTVEGVPMGRASGLVELALEPSERGVALDVDVPKLRLELPASSTRNVQSLDEVSTIQVSQPLGPPARKRDADAFEWAVSVSLGDVRAGSTGVDVRVRTLEDAPLSLVLSDELRTRGEIVLAGGEVELNKRRFEIDRGIIRLREEDAGNPYVNVTAHVDVGDGSVIYVDYVGLLSPITDEKIRFRSDPPRSQAEIVSLLLFGDTTASPGAGSVVGSVGGTVATALANELLAQSVFRDVSINLGSTEEGGYVQAAMPLGESLRIDLSVGAQQQQGARPVGTAGSSAGQTCRDVGLDYRITKRWSLRAWGGLCNAEAEDVRTSVGVDAVWQYSY